MVLIAQSLSLSSYHHLELASVAQLEARLSGDQEVVGSTLDGLATFLCGDLS